MRLNPSITGVRRSATLAGAALLMLAAACGGGDDGPTTPPAANEVTVSDNVFTPATRTVPAGTTVTWRWAGGSSMHNVTFAAGTSSPNQTSGTFQRLFSTAGSFPYQCTIHGAGMSGTITVP
jgi:plastocyanin